MEHTYKWEAQFRKVIREGFGRVQPLEDKALGGWFWGFLPPHNA